MRTIENECVGCPPEIGCIGISCSYNNVVHYYCDCCGEETKLYHYNGYEICESCLIKQFDIVEGSDL